MCQADPEGKRESALLSFIGANQQHEYWFGKTSTENTRVWGAPSRKRAPWLESARFLLGQTVHIWLAPPPSQSNLTGVSFSQHPKTLSLVGMQCSAHEHPKTRRPLFQPLT